MNIAVFWIVMLVVSWVSTIISGEHTVYIWIQSNPYTVSPPFHQSSTTSFSAHGRVWTEICYYTVYLYTTTIGVPPKIEVDKQWHYIGVWLCVIMVPIESF